MRVLVTGASGQLGREVVLALTNAGQNVLGCNRDELDITDEVICDRKIQDYRPDVVIHCAAFTAVDKAEEEADLAYKVNCIGTRNIAIAAESVGAKLVYISTDYVFDGLSSNTYVEYDSTNPKSVYGKTKLAGEVVVQNFSTKHFIVRTSWVYGLYGSNFVKTMLQLGQNKPEVKVVNDQTGSPTYTLDLANFIIELILTNKFGIYHASNSGKCTWYEFTQEIFSEAKKLGFPINANLIPCTTEDFPRPAPRPKNSVMEHMAIRANGFLDIRSWQDGLRAFLFELKN
ncbi:dTDP-4-dehydrorhamnose reductase [Paenibacillus shunpengii]|uniref:dTDP-4-dehydrorhamnose reductase n=1 Tax=Paenibacillus shunpengii TaxID=2054424 RepID=A0ABW5SV43_9BACL